MTELKIGYIQYGYSVKLIIYTLQYHNATSEFHKLMNL